MLSVIISQLVAIYCIYYQSQLIFCCILFCNI